MIGRELQRLQRKVDRRVGLLRGELLLGFGGEAISRPSRGRRLPEQRDRLFVERDRAGGVRRFAQLRRFVDLGRALLRQLLVERR